MVPFLIPVCNYTKVFDTVFSVDKYPSRTCMTILHVALMHAGKILLKHRQFKDLA